jgi:fatty acid CoA ligase FadD36
VTAPSSLFGAIERSDDRVAVTVGEAGLRRGDLFAAAAAVADRVHGAPVVAVHAEATLSTVVAVLGCLLAGVPLVPVPPDSGPKERAHVLRDSGAGPAPRSDQLLGCPPSVTGSVRPSPSVMTTLSPGA